MINDLGLKKRENAGCPIGSGMGTGGKGDCGICDGRFASGRLRRILRP